MTAGVGEATPHRTQSLHRQRVQGSATAVVRPMVETLNRLPHRTALPPVSTTALLPARGGALKNDHAVAQGRHPRRASNGVPTLARASETVIAIHAENWRPQLSRATFAVDAELHFHSWTPPVHSMSGTNLRCCFREAKLVCGDDAECSIFRADVANPVAGPRLS